ncbi:Kelch domain protein [Sandaracinus amylolyticus]|uniref:Kelch domain protein n=1 Tax=Sandaracinus amylolyticus TaxID=927083 RepID=A0A0F6W7Z8_9BACT|nr:Kelch domain protein [Sandaracinus amylolyticus]
MLSFVLSACGGSSDDPPIVLPDAALPDASAFDAGAGDVDAGPRVALAIEPTGSIHVARLGHTATRLPSGRVLFVGGEDLGRVPTASIEEYDPETGAFEEVAMLPAARVNHTATLLADGRVLVAGGGASASNGVPAGTAVTESVVIYDPSTHDVIDAAAMAHARGHHGAILLSDGRVLVAGGAATPASGGGFAPVASIEIFDPEEGTWSEGGALAAPRAMLSLVEHDGAVLVIGGFAPTGAPHEIERIDTTTGAVSPGGRLAGPGRFFHATLRTRDDDVLVVGGLAPPVFLDVVEALGSSDEAFRALPELPSPRNSIALVETSAAVLAIGGFFFSPSTGGQSIEDVLALDPEGERFEVVGSIPLGRSGHTATVLASGDVLVAGGYTSVGMTDVALLVRAE